MLTVSLLFAAPAVAGAIVAEATVAGACLPGATEVDEAVAGGSLPGATGGGAPLLDAAGWVLLDVLGGAELPRPELARESLCLAREKGVVGLVIFSLTRSNVSNCTASVQA